MVGLDLTSVVDGVDLGELVSPVLFGQQRAKTRLVVTEQDERRSDNQCDLGDGKGLSGHTKEAYHFGGSRWAVGDELCTLMLQESQVETRMGVELSSEGQEQSSLG